MAAFPIRRWVTIVHRYVGIFLAGFLILEGLTGAVLAFKAPLERMIAPQLYAVRPPGGRVLPLGRLAEAFESRQPGARIGYFWIDGDQAILRLAPPKTPATGGSVKPDYDQAILDPYTGKTLALRRYGDLSQGLINLVPFLYALHLNLNAGETGRLVLGCVALIWTLDTLYSLYLTLPAGRVGFWRRWGKAFWIKKGAGTFRLNFDLHRAAGLWFYPLLLIFAWSSVMFDLPEVYDPTMQALTPYRSDMEVLTTLTAQRKPIDHPALSWSQAEARGASLMAQGASAHGVRIFQPYGMAYIEMWGVYTYAVSSSDNVSAGGWASSLWLDGNSGNLVQLDLPRLEKTGNQADLWLRALHFADFKGSLLYRSVAAATGLVMALLSTTGLYIWWKKRAARRATSLRRRAPTNP
jgi:uncharacterized iron-regulated membrane protein